MSMIVVPMEWGALRSTFWSMIQHKAAKEEEVEENVESALIKQKKKWRKQAFHAVVSSLQNNLKIILGVYHRSSGNNCSTILSERNLKII